MYAVIKTGGKQYRVAPGQKLKIEQIPSDIGAVVSLDQILAVGNGDKSLIGEPLVAGATVSVTVLDQARAPKIRVFKMRRRKGYRKTQGHRQHYTEIFISQIESSLGSESADAGLAMANSNAVRVKRASGSGIAAIVGVVGGSTQTASLTAAPAKADGAVDKLTKIEGIGPKIAELLNAAGINTFAELSQASEANLQKVLDDAGPRFAVHKPGTWAAQAKMAAAGEWDALKKWQDELDGGRPA